MSRVSGATAASASARAFQELQAKAAAGIAFVKAGGCDLRGLVCGFFALTWGFAALPSGLFGEIPSAVGIGLMAFVAGWMGRRSFARARAMRRA